MSFVRKPRPYSSGLPHLPGAHLSSAASPVPRAKQRSGRLATARPRRSSWATAVTLLATLGTAALLLVGGTGLANLLWHDAQYRAAAAGVADVMR